MKFKQVILFAMMVAGSALILEPAVAQKVVLTTPQGGSTYFVSDQVTLTAEIANPAYLHIYNTQTGYRKLKIGYSPVNLYSPLINVTSGGNNTLEITLQNFGDAVNWTKIQVRPQGSTAAPVALASFIAAAGGVDNVWKTISIPLSAFDPSINFSQISLIELPYSAGAGSFDLGISKIAFTGGTTPFVWFGADHTNNLHNGNGGSGEVNAQLVVPAEGSKVVEQVGFFVGEELIGTVNAQPYSIVWPAITEGIYDLSARVIYSDGSFIQSGATSITVNQKPVCPYTIQITNPLPGSLFEYPSEIPVSVQVGGVSLPDPAWIHVTNNQTGYRKLKIGYDPKSLYTPRQNVISGGNTVLEITLKDAAGNTNWAKIQVRPQGSTVTPISLAPYISAVGGITSEWKTISIPLSAFDASIDFSQISLIELPYSLSAGNLDLGIQRIAFTGGSEPFIWFGGSKTDNSHNGNGGAGELAASVIPSAPGGPGVSHVDFFADNLLVHTDRTAPYEFLWLDAETGDHSLSAKLTDKNSLTAHAIVVPVQVNQVQPNQITLTVKFDTPPSPVLVEKSALRYNKAFAYSFTLDDGLIDAYTIAYPLLRGGLVAENNTLYPGYFYTDGCGNAIPFSAGISWYSVNSAGSDIHVNTPSYINWTQLATLYSEGWNVFNHSYSHSAYGSTDYVWQINQNKAYIKEKSGIDVTHFVVPSGDQAYVAPAFTNGMLTVNGNNGAYRGSPNGYRIDQPIDFKNFTLYKMLLADANHNTTNIMQKINSVAAASLNGQHYWWIDFTHHVGSQPSGSSLLFPLFQFYMENIANQYGMGGADNMWMAPVQDVYEYLSVRDNTLLAYSISGNILTVTLDYSGVPDNLRTNAITLTVQSDQNFSEVSSSGSTKTSFNGTGSNKIINVQWGKSQLKAKVTNYEDNQPVTLKPEAIQVSAWPVPFTSQIHINYGSTVDGEIEIHLFNMAGIVVFTKMVNAQKGQNAIRISLQNENLSPGAYFLKLSSRCQTYQTIKIVKIND
jgi:hypothetical protein